VPNPPRILNPAQQAQLREQLQEMQVQSAVFAELRRRLAMTVACGPHPIAISTHLVRAECLGATAQREVSNLALSADPRGGDARLVEEIGAVLEQVIGDAIGRHAIRSLADAAGLEALDRLAEVLDDAPSGAVPAGAADALAPILAAIRAAHAGGPAWSPGAATADAGVADRAAALAAMLAGDDAPDVARPAVAERFDQTDASGDPP
jgi:hypothetical protein